MLKIEINSGSRKNFVLTLHAVSESQSSPVFLLEDEMVVIRTVLDEEIPNLSLLLHDVEIPHTIHYLESEKWVYEWRPRDLTGPNRCFFRNYYGFAELALVSKIQPSDNSYDFVRAYHPVEVLAKKLTAEKIASMIEFLARDEGRDLAAAIRVTRLRAGYKPGGRTEAFILERIEHNLTYLKSILPTLFANPIKRYGSKQIITIPHDRAIIDEGSLQWALENPDSLSISSDGEQTFMDFNGEHYGAHKIAETTITTDFNVYENQVLHGFVMSLVNSTLEIKNRLTQAPVRSTENPFTEGYVSFFSQLNKLSSTINRGKVEKCLKLLYELRNILAWLRANLPVGRISLGFPKFTQKSKHNLAYRSLFNRMISWKKFGGPDWGLQDELNSIKDVPKLFEYYVLLATKTHLSAISGLKQIESDDVANEDLFVYEGEFYSIRLKYEPNIWTVGHAQSFQSDLVNTEAWTIKNRRDLGNKDFSISRRGTRGGYANRCPDILIQIERKFSNSVYIVIDAKYTDKYRAFTDYLPELTMKYIHGIHRRESDNNPSIALIIVNPDEQASTRHFHHDDYSIYGKYPVKPALLVSSIDVGKSHNKGSNLHSDLLKTIEHGIASVISQNTLA